MGFRTVTLEVDTAAGGGGTVDSSPLMGALCAVEIDFIGAGASTTVDIDEIVSGGLGRKILDKGAANTDVTLYPRVAVQDNTGTAVTYDGTNEIYERFVFGGRSVRVTVAGAGGVSSVRVRLTLEV